MAISFVVRVVVFAFIWCISMTSWNAQNFYGGHRSPATNAVDVLLQPKNQSNDFVKENKTAPNLTTIIVVCSVLGSALIFGTVFLCLCTGFGNYCCPPHQPRTVRVFDSEQMPLLRSSPPGPSSSPRLLSERSPVNPIHSQSCMSSPHGEDLLLEQPRTEGTDNPENIPLHDLCPPGPSSSQRMLSERSPAKSIHSQSCKSSPRGDMEQSLTDSHQTMESEQLSKDEPKCKQNVTSSSHATGGAFNLPHRSQTSRDDFQFMTTFDESTSSTNLMDVPGRSHYRAQGGEKSENDLQNKMQSTGPNQEVRQWLDEMPSNIEEHQRPLQDQNRGIVRLAQPSTLPIASSSLPPNMFSEVFPPSLDQSLISELNQIRHQHSFTVLMRHLRSQTQLHLSLLQRSLQFEDRRFSSEASASSSRVTNRPSSRRRQERFSSFTKRLHKRSLIKRGKTRRKRLHSYPMSSRCLQCANKRKRAAELSPIVEVAEGAQSSSTSSTE